MAVSNLIDQAFLRKLTEIVLANLENENFGVKDLVQKSGYSRYRLAGKLQSLKNKTVNQFIREVRLQRALEILQEEDITTTEVAYKVGFNNVTYFNTCFHEFFGYPPGKVKKKASVISEVNLLGPVTAEQDHKRPAWRKIIYSSGGSLILIGIIYLVYAHFSGTFTADKSNTAIINGKSLAVLPFRNLSEVNADQYIYDGIMDEIFNSLTKIHELRVISHTSVEQYRNTVKTSPVIGRELDVDYLIEGSGQKIGNTFRIRVQLIEVSTDKHVWAGSYQYNMKRTKKFFRIQSRIAKNIATELRATITRDEKVLIEKVPTADITAYTIYLKAREYHNDYEKTRNPGSYQTAVDMYNTSLKIDSAFARAYTGLAGIYFSRYRLENYFKKNYLDSMQILVNKALDIDDQLEEAYYLKGEFYRLNGQSETALVNYDHALEINPNYYPVYPVKGFLFALSSGDYVKALDNYRKGLTLIRGEGRRTLLANCAYDYLCVGFIEKAKYYYHEAFELDSNKAAYLSNLSWIEFCQGNFDLVLNYKNQQKEMDSSAIDLLTYAVIPGHDKERYLDAEKYVEKRKKSGALTINSSHRIGYAFWQAGKKKEAKNYFDQQIKYCIDGIKFGRETARRKTAYYDLAATYAFLGDKDKAYINLDELSKRNTFPLWWVTLAKNDPLLNSLRNEERFQKILRDMESKYLAEHERVKKWLEEQGSL